MGLKDLFFKPAQEKPTEKPASSTDSGAAPPTFFSHEQPLPGPQKSVSLDPAPFLEQLKEAMHKADLPGGQTYLAFSKALENMQKLPMDEATKFQAAFATLQATGCDVSQLTESISYFQGILNAEKDKFEEALHATIGDSVVKKENEIKELTDQNADYSAQIQKLTESIAANQRNITLHQGELAEVNGKLKQKEDSFMAAFHSMQEQLQVDARKIATYLGAASAAQPASDTKHKK